MITTTEVAKRTGLSVKTLMRWAQRGIIPKPATGTHPNGRGKIGYWPDHVLDRCVQLAQFRREGYSIESAVLMLQAEQLNERLEALEKPTLASVLADKKVRTSDGREVTLLDVFAAAIAADLKRSVLDTKHHDEVNLFLKDNTKLRLAVNYIQRGYNPYLTFDGKEVRVEPDFLLSQALASDDVVSLFHLPLRPPLQRLFAALGAENAIGPPNVMPAPKVWMHTGDVMVEYTIYLAGPLGFEILKETGQTIGNRKEVS